jgi:hypothetical protein
VLSHRLSIAQPAVPRPVPHRGRDPVVINTVLWGCGV